MFVAKRILIITNDTKFAVNVKKALERNGEYTVSAFSSGKAGVDYLRQNPQDVAVLDFRMKDMPGTDMVDHMRAMQPDLAIIVAPDHPAIHDLKERHNIQEIINIPIPIRKFVSILNTAATEMYNAQTDTNTSNSIQGLSVERSAQTFEFWLADTEDGETVLELSDGLEPDVKPQASATFQRLAAEEPPMPDFIDGSTIRDLRDKLTNLDEIKRVLATASDEDTAPAPKDVEVVTDEEEKDASPIPAMVILEAALDESTPIQTFSLQEFMSRVTEKGVDTINPLPSWKKEEERYVAEPDFLPSDLPFPELEEAIEYTGTVTMISAAQVIEDDPSNWTTDPIKPVQRSHPVEEKRQELESVTEEPDVEEAIPLDSEEIEAPVEELAHPTPPLPPELPDLTVSSGTDSGLAFTEFESDDPELAQLATTLTQVALELTADATVLAKNGEVVAFAGKLPMSDLAGLLDQLTVEWDKVSNNDKSRILFATIPDTGAEFMVSTRGTDAGFTLSLIFSGTRPLHDIRRQSKRLVDALATMPEPEAEPVPIITPQPTKPAVAIPTTDEIGIRTPIAYLWLQRDPNEEFDNDIQQAILKSLDVDLTTAGWKVGEIQAPDYVYIYGEMPANLDPRETLNELMQKTATIAKQEASDLWDDSYLILQPGREMKAEEIQRFINFARR